MDNIEKLSSIENYDSMNQSPLRQGSLVRIISGDIEKIGVIFDFKEEYNSWGDFKYGVLLLNDRGLPDYLYWGEYDRNIELLPEQDYNYGWKLILYYVDRNIFTNKIRSNFQFGLISPIKECRNDFSYPLSDHLMRSITIGGTIDYLKSNEKGTQLPDKCIDALDKFISEYTGDDKSNRKE